MKAYEGVDVYLQSFLTSAVGGGEHVIPQKFAVYKITFISGWRMRMQKRTGPSMF
jgi:hypothetical protein